MDVKVNKEFEDYAFDGDDESIIERYVQLILIFITD